MFHHLEFRAHGHATEEEDRVRQAFTFVSGMEAPEVTRTQGYFGDPIVILRGRLEKAGPIREFWNRLRDGELLDAVVQTLDRRVDADGNLYLRFDKQAAYGGRLSLADHDDVVSLRGKIAAYPAKRDRALAVARTFFQEGHP